MHTCASAGRLRRFELNEQLWFLEIHLVRREFCTSREHTNMLRVEDNVSISLAGHVVQHEVFGRENEPLLRDGRAKYRSVRDLRVSFCYSSFQSQSVIALSIMRDGYVAVQL